MNKIRALLCVLLISLSFNLKANEINQPLPFENLNKVQEAFSSADGSEAVVYYPYDNNSVHKVRMRIGMTTTFLIPETTEIAEYNLAMSSNELFTIHQSEFKNVLMITPSSAGFDTTLTIFDNRGRIYQYYIRVDNTYSPHIPHLKVYVADNYAKGELVSENIDYSSDDNLIEFQTTNNQTIASTEISDEATQTLDDLNRLDNQKSVKDYILTAKRERTNFAYKYIGGDLNLKPTFMFDDGVNTYFVFRSLNGNKPKELPNIYQVVDGIDKPITQRETMNDGTVVIKTIAESWSIRLGDKFFCVERGT